METVMDVDLRCPSCSARVRPQEQWCSLCHTDLRARPEPAPVGPALDQTVERHHDAGPTAGLGAGPDAGAQAPAATRDGRSPEAVADEMLARLAASEGGSGRLGAAAGPLRSPAARAGVVLAGASVLALVCFALLALLGTAL